MDPARLAVVGHDFGGMTGMLAAAADGRPRCHVLLALTPRFEHWMFYDPKKRPTDEQDYRRQLAAIDPIDALPALEGPVLIQLARGGLLRPPRADRGLAQGGRRPGRAPDLRHQPRHGGAAGPHGPAGVAAPDAGCWRPTEGRVARVRGTILGPARPPVAVDSSTPGGEDRRGQEPNRPDHPRRATVSSDEDCLGNRPELDELTRSYLAAQLAGDRREAVRLLMEEGIGRGNSVIDLHLRVIQEAQREIGRLWEAELHQRRPGAPGDGGVPARAVAPLPAVDPSPAGGQERARGLRGGRAARRGRADLRRRAGPARVRGAVPRGERAHRLPPQLRRAHPSVARRAERDLAHPPGRRRRAAVEALRARSRVPHRRRRPGARPARGARGLGGGAPSSAPTPSSCSPAARARPSESRPESLDDGWTRVCSAGCTGLPGT